MESAGASFIKACHNIKRIHDKLLYKRPGFVEWCRSKSGLSHQTAGRMLRVAGMLPESGNIPIKSREAIYLLASPETPPEARRVTIERAQAGEKITPRKVQVLIKQVAAETTHVRPVRQPAPPIEYALQQKQPV